MAPSPDEGDRVVGTGIDGPQEGGRDAVAVGQSPTHGHEENPDAAGHRRTAVPGGYRPVGLDRRTAGYEADAGGVLEIPPVAGDELLGKPRVQDHHPIVRPIVDKFKNILI
jgi:hypothetical protein